MIKEKFRHSYSGECAPGSNYKGSEMKPYEFAKQPERFSCVVYAWEDLLTEIEQLKAENKKLRIAARLIHQRAQVPSGSKEMGDIDAYCKEVGLEVWTWRLDK